MTDVQEILDHVDPAVLAYDEWLAVGMALHHEGYSSSVWDQWSQRDPKRYQAGLCARKWAGFNGAGVLVTAGTVFALAQRQGWRPEASNDPGYALDWGDIVSADHETGGIDTTWADDVEVIPPDDWNPVEQITTYLMTLFEAHEYVGYVTESYVNNDGKHVPRKGAYARTAGELLQALATCDGDIGKALGDYSPEAGAWIRFNPLDGQGVSDANVTAFRYALVESDSLPIERQAAIYAEMELPVAALVHSGKKSLHAIVRVNAQSKEEYRERVQYLHKVCKKSGLEIDGANKNPSRLSRLPGIMRNGEKQFLVAVNQGKPSWEEWKAFVEEANDSLPDFEPLETVWNCLPELAPPLIDGVLRTGHKMLLAGPSKAGKSFLLLQLVIAIAEGRAWLGWPCRKGRVLYVNLELDRASCLHRLRNLYDSLGFHPSALSNIDIWNLRGNSVPMDQLAPKLIRRALKARYAAVILDPIYKVLTGSENEAEDMARFCNQFDMVCQKLGAAVIYCHHHSKGAQGGKSSRDRSSGSGVFARDPDAILDIIELNISDQRRKALVERAVCDRLAAVLDATHPDWRENFSDDDALVLKKMEEEARRLVGPDIAEDIMAATEVASAQSGWRLEGTLREFPAFQPRSFWFRYPMHVIDESGMLADAKADGEEAPWETRKRENAEKGRGQKADPNARLESAWSAATNLEETDHCHIEDIAREAIADPELVRKWFRNNKSLLLSKDGTVRRKETAIAKAKDLLGNGMQPKEAADELGLSEGWVKKWAK